MQLEQLHLPLLTVETEGQPVHWVCQTCYPDDPKFGETTEAVCGARALFDYYIEVDQPYDVPDCTPCSKAKRCTRGHKQ
jgi:hypothetical protein